MSDGTLKDCHTCGSIAIIENGFAKCRNVSCWMHDVAVKPHLWNTRKGEPK
jgi:hypothetical protein